MLEIVGDKFYLEEKKINIYSGAIHYFRVMPEYWEDRLTKLKLAGFNTVETYVSWNLHEPQKGKFNFNGILDIVKFLKIAQKVGLYAIVRPGPYICAEWDFGGFPAWLLKDKNIRLRCNNELFLKHVKDFFDKLLPMINEMSISKGGNVIAMQIENEYGSYGNDKEYLAKLEKMFKDNKVDAMLFASDGDFVNMISGGSLPHIYKMLNFGSRAKTAFNSLKGIQDNAPKMCGEFWDGWFDHWGDKHHTRGYKSIVAEVNDFLAMDGNFNFYMFHGGTNFNFWAGANHNNGKYLPTVTSYDYSALLTEWGGYTDGYHAVRDILLKHQNITPQPLIEDVKFQNIGEVQLTEFASLKSNVKNLAEKHRSATPESMEHFGQNFGYILYHTVIEGSYCMSNLTFAGIKDRAYLYINGKKKAVFDRNDKQKLFRKKGIKHSILLPGFKDKVTIDVLVDAMGRVNYGAEMYDRKGIESISIGQQFVYGYDVYTLPMDNLEKLLFDGQSQCPAFLKGTFKTNSKNDCFVNMTGFTKGFVVINGFNIGRFWKAGPQKALYIPGCLLKEENEIIIFEQEGFSKASVIINDVPALK